MSRRKKLNIITTDSNLAVKDHVASETLGLHTSEKQVSLSSSQEFQSTNEREATIDEDHQVAMASNKNKNQSLLREANEYEKSRLLRVQENQKRLKELGVKNIVQSLTSLTHSQTLKKKTVKKNSQAGDVEYILDSGDDIQVGRSVVSKKQQPPKYIPPMSINRVANLRKLCRVFASNITQEAPSTSNATKHTLSETVEGNKRRAKRRMVLIDEADDEDDEIFEGNRLDMEVDDVHHDFEYENMDDTIHTNNQYDAQMIDHDNLQQQIQQPDNEKATGTPKKVRSHTQKAEIWKMVSNERILVMFNKYGKPVGDEGKELVQYLGTLVRMPEHVSIEYSDWRKVPMQQKEDMYSLVKSKFSFHQGETSQIKKWILYSMGKKWRTWKGILKSRGYDASLTIDEIVTQQTNSDDRVNATQFKELVKRWFTPEFQTTCAKKRWSRSKMKEPHVTGTKSFARLAHEVAMKNDGVYPTREEMYIKTRTRKDGSVVDDEAARVVTSLKAIESGSTSTLEDRDDFTKDDYSKVKGPEKRGYVRLVGRMPATKDKSDSPSNSQIIHQLQSAVNVMMNIIQEHIPDANLSTVLSDMNIQVPRIDSSTLNNSISGNELSSSRCHDNEGIVDKF